MWKLFGWSGLGNRRSEVLAAIPEHEADLPSEHAVRAVDDEQKIFSLRVGLWTKLATRDLKSYSCWATLQIASTTRAPIGHCLFLNQKGGCRPSKLKNLIWTKAGEILSEFDVLLVGSGRDGIPRQWSELVALIRSHGLDDAYWTSLAVLCTVQTAADFHFRVCLEREAYPLRLFWLSS